MDNRIMAEKVYGYDVDDVYNAMAYTETGGESDPFIRTKASKVEGGSNAYGPVQMLSSFVADSRNAIYADTKKPMIKYTEDELDYIDRFIEQGDKLYLHGNEEDKVWYDSKYDYGGSGDLTSDKDKKLYKSVAKKIISYELKRAKGDLDKFQGAWRGKTEHFEGGVDLRHLSGFRAKLKKLQGTRELMPDEAVMGEFIRENVR